MRKVTKKRLNLVLFLASVALFLYVLVLFGADAFELIKLNVNFYYLAVVMGIAFISFIPYTMRFKVILEAYGKKVPFWTLFRHALSAFAVSYVTPFSRLGGEPIRIYMLKKEGEIDYRTGSSVVLLDKYIDVLGGTVYVIIGLALIMFLPQASLALKIIMIAIILFFILILGGIYIQGMRGKGYFSNFFILFRGHKIKRISHWLGLIKDVEAKMNRFFEHHKKEFLWACFYYLVTAVVHILLIKVLLLSIGFDFPVTRIILIITAWGLLNFVPTPAGLGALEAGQSALFLLLEGNGSIGLAMTLILRVGYLTMVALGFIFLSQFSRRQLKKERVNLSPNIG
jgi:glycosyltransferase 2 family protein